MNRRASYLFAAFVLAIATTEAGAQEVRPAPQRGADAAPVEIVVFADLTSAAWSNASVVLDVLMERAADQVRIVFHHGYAADNLEADLVHRVAAAAHAQGKFWELHALIAANQDRLAYHDLLQMAAQAGLDAERLAADYAGPLPEAAIARDRALAAQRKVTGAVALFVNGKRLPGAVTMAALQKSIAGK